MLFHLDLLALMPSMPQPVLSHIFLIKRKSDSFQIIHHLLSLIAVSYAMLSGEGQLYTFMVLLSETTTPGINLRWWISRAYCITLFEIKSVGLIYLDVDFISLFARFLDTAGMKRSKAYLINGIGMFAAWLVIKIFALLFFFCLY